MCKPKPKMTPEDYKDGTSILMLLVGIVLGYWLKGWLG